MLFGDKLVLDAWNAFCDELKSAGEDVLKRTDLAVLDRVEGVRHLTRLVRMRLDWDLEAADVRHPTFFQPATETKKAAYDCPDYIYHMALIDGSSTYRITGFAGDSELLTFMSYAPAPGGGALRCTGVLETPDIPIGPDGHFEIIVSKDKQQGAWLPMEWNSCQLQFRDVTSDRKHRRNTQLAIENVAPPPLEPLTGRTLVNCLEAALESLRVWKDKGPEFTRLRRESARNAFEVYDTQGAGGAYPNQVYLYGYWELAPDEALVIDVDLPRCRYWNLHLCNHWAESLDFTNANTSLNPRLAQLGGDGRLRVVIAERDPGQPNWLSTLGHGHGTMVFRFLHPDRTPAPSTKVVTLGELAGRR